MDGGNGLKLEKSEGSGFLVAGMNVGWAGDEK